MIVAVSGSSGFIGRRLVKRLLAVPHTVCEMDIARGFDITDWVQLDIIPRFDVCIHLASRSFVPDSFRMPREFFYVNVMGTLNLLELCRRYQARMIYVSSYVYGSPLYLPVDEGHPLSAHNPYAQSKIIAEQVCQYYSWQFRVPVIVFRPFNIYGPSQSEPFLIPSIIRQAKMGSVLLKDPRPKRDWLFVDDFIEAVLLAMGAVDKSFEVFNLGSGSSYSVTCVVDVILEALGKKVPVTYLGEEREHEVMETFADIRKARNLLSWEPHFDLRGGIRKCLEEEAT